MQFVLTPFLFGRLVTDAHNKSCALWPYSFFSTVCESWEKLPWKTVQKHASMVTTQTQRSSLAFTSWSVSDFGFPNTQTPFVFSVSKRFSTGVGDPSKHYLKWFEAFHWLIITEFWASNLLVCVSKLSSSCFQDSNKKFYHTIVSDHFKYHKGKGPRKQGNYVPVIPWKHPLMVIIIWFQIELFVVTNNLCLHLAPTSRLLLFQNKFHQTIQCNFFSNLFAAHLEWLMNITQYNTNTFSEFFCFYKIHIVQTSLLCFHHAITASIAF